MKSHQKPPARKVHNSGKPAGKKKPSLINPLIIGDIVILVMAFIAFSPTLTGELLGWDDYNYIRDNQLIRMLSWENIQHVFNYKTVVVGNYHPLTVLSYMLEYQAAGLNPFLYHFDNLLLHLCNTLLVSWLVWLLTKRTNATLIVTALFALHPMRVESVVWAAERKDVLYTFFFLLSLISYVYFLMKERQKISYYLLSLGFFILSVLSKGQAVVLPLVLFLVDYWFARKPSLKTIINKLPFLLLSVLSGIVALLSQHSSLTEHRLSSLSVAERMIVALYNLSAYLYKMVFPFNLSAFYKYPAPGDWGWIYAGAALTIVIAGVVYYLFRKEKPVVFGAFFYLFTISIVIQLLPVGNAILADRYTYVPYIGLFFIAGVLADRYISGGRNRKAWLAVPVVIVLIFSVKTYVQSQVWHNNETLWKNAINQDPDNGVALSNLGRNYIEVEGYNSAIPLLIKAIQNEATFPDVYNAYQNLGVAYSRTNRYEEALLNFRASLSRRPGYLDAIFSMGICYTSLGRYDSAVSSFTTVITSVDSLHSRSYYSRGVVYNKMNRADLAVADYTNALRIDPQYCDAYNNRGNIYFTQNIFDKALGDYSAAITIDPSDGKTFLNRSFVYFKTGRFKEALNDALKAKELKMEVHPNYIRDLELATTSMVK